jgi:hypothetical protein
MSIVQVEKRGITVSLTFNLQTPQQVTRKRLRNVNHIGPIVAAMLDDVRR